MSRSITRRIAVAGVAAATAFSLAACASENSATSGSSSAAKSTGADAAKEAAFPRTIDGQDNNRAPVKVEIPAQPKRIVSGSVSLTGALLSLDAPVIASGGGNPKAPMFADDTGFARAWQDLAAQKNVKSIFTIGSQNAEAILAEQPDLVVMSNVGADNGNEFYEQIKGLVPVQVIDYSKQSWQETTREVAKSTGLEDKAEEVIADYEKAAKETKDKIEVDGPVNIVSLGREGAMNFFTKESAQGQVLSDLGIEIAVPDENLHVQNQQGANRGDIKVVSAENIPLALTAPNVLVMDIDPGKPASEQVRENPALAQAPAIVGNKLKAMDAKFFRIDAIAARALVDYVAEHFKK